MIVFHFLTRKHGLDDLRQRRLKIATISDLNDPFELLGPALLDQYQRQRFQNLKDKLAVSRGLLCFSRNWPNPVQWSHYAERHRGLCLGFDIPEQCLIKVNYSNKRLEPSVVALLDRGGAVAENEMQKVLTTKYSHWRYENEMRVFLSLSDKDPDSGLYFADFSDKLMLKEVIVGHCSTISRHELNDALSQLAPSVSVFKARLAFKSFKVVRQRKAALWE